MKIPFDIKYRPQIESGKYKVETREGLHVRIICWDWLAKKHNDDDLNLCVLVPDDGGEAVYYYHRSGKRWVPNDDYDLFIVTPEPEMSEFELKVKEILYADKPEYSASDPESWKRVSSELLTLARKEIEEGLKEKVLYDYWKQAYDQCAKARKEAKAEALKDLPRWCKSKGVYEDGWINDGFLYYKNHSIQLSSLEKLPGFKEDEK